MAEVPVDKVVIALHAANPVSILHEVENQGVATGIDRKLNPQVNAPIPPPPQVTESTRTTLSRWRHGSNPVGDVNRASRLAARLDDGAYEPVPAWLSDGGYAAHNFVRLAQD
jgi:hypothetical protein